MAKEVVKRDPARGIFQLRWEMDRLFEDFSAQLKILGQKTWKN